MVDKTGCGRDTSKVIERLRASRQAAVSAKFQEGHQAGEEWASEIADYVELRRLGQMKEGTSPVDWDLFWDTGVNDANCASERLAFVIRPDDNEDRQAAAAFWETAVGDGVDLTDDFVRGFVDGALDVWREVRDKL